MGRYNFAAQNVHKHATQLLQAHRIPAPPPWYNIVANTPPSTRLVRPAMQRGQKAGAKPGRKKSKLFQPLSVTFKEDALRWEYFNDHPWELARPRVILENDGRDHEKWDWSLPLDYALRRPRIHKEAEIWEDTMKKQSARPLNGEAVIQRQNHLINAQGLNPSTAYDQARKELYRQRHAKEIAVRVAREEAMAFGAYFGPGPLEIGMHVEDQQYEAWRSWAAKEIQMLKASQAEAYTGTEAEDGAEATELEPEGLEEIWGQVPGSKGGQTAMGGAAVPP